MTTEPAPERTPETTMTLTHQAPTEAAPSVRGPRRKPARRSTSAQVRSVLKHLGLVALSLIMIYPLIWLVVSSFKPNSEIFSNLSIFTTDLTLENYTHGWTSQQVPFSVFITNSLVIAIAAIIGNLVSCSLAA